MKEKWDRLGQVAAGGAWLLTGIGVARWKAWPAVEKCLLFPSLSAVGSWEEVLYSVPELF